MIQLLGNCVDARHYHPVHQRDCAAYGDKAARKCDARTGLSPRHRRDRLMGLGDNTADGGTLHNLAAVHRQRQRRFVHLANNGVCRTRVCVFNGSRGSGACRVRHCDDQH